MLSSASRRGWFVGLWLGVVCLLGVPVAGLAQNPASYKFKGNEQYVRARIEDSGGRRAWTQPVFLVPSR